MAGISEYTSPVFRPLKSRPTILALGAAEWGRVVLTALIAAAVAFSLGFWTKTADLPLKSSEIISATAGFNSIKDSVAKIDSRMESAGLTSYAQLDLSADEEKAIAEAQQYGITANTSREEIESLVPETKQATVPVIDDIPRWFIFFVLPVLLVAGVNIEYSHGTTLWRELKRIVANARGQHVLVSRPKTYLTEIKD